MYRVFIEYRSEIKVITVNDYGNEDLSEKLTELMKDTNFVKILKIEPWGDLV